MRNKKNIVLLDSDSRESLLKHKGYAQAAQQLGIEIQKGPDRHTLAVIPTSDQRAIDAAWIGRQYGIPGPDPLAVTAAFQKPLAYQFLAGRGFPVLDWFTPLREADLRSTGPRLEGPVFVKPEYGSGSYSPYPWGYRKFSSVGAFHRYLKKHGWIEEFFKVQKNPPFGSARFMVMEYVGGPMYAVGAALGETHTGVFVRKETRIPDGGNMMPDRLTFGVATAATRAIEAMIGALHAFGLRRTCVFLQCVYRDGIAYPVDINLRPGNAIAKLADAMNLPLYEEILGCTLGLKPSFEFALPARYAQLHRWMLPLESGQAKVYFPDPAIALIDEYSYDANKAHDRGYARPMFAVLAERRSQLEPRAQRVIEHTRIEMLKPGS